jgi:capsular exopolysaccharide synthesis family protein
MDHIRQAIERARAPVAPDIHTQQQIGSTARQNPQFGQPVGAAGEPRTFGNVVTLDGKVLEANRIISHDIANPLSKSFDILRTQVLQTMDMNSWQLLGITSPTAGCGKSVIAVNLALSIARQRERSVLLVDLDLQKPQIANHLGLKCDKGVMSVLEGRTDLSSAIIQARVRNQQFLVLPCETATPSSSEWMASRQLNAVMEEIKQTFKSWTVILDLPPILTSDDVISILPQVNSVLFVAAAGSTTASEIKACNKHLEATPVVRVVLNKSEDAIPSYYHY